MSCMQSDPCWKAMAVEKAIALYHKAVTLSPKVRSGGVYSDIVYKQQTLPSLI